MNESVLLAMLRQAEDRLRQLEYRIRILEDAQGSNAQVAASLRAAPAP
jgi:hypothetical protein